MQEKAKKAELRMAYEVIAEFGPPVAVGMPPASSGAEGRWTIRGHVTKSNNFLLKHGDPKNMAVRFLIGTDWWTIPEVVNVEFKSMDGKKFVKVYAKGQEIIGD